MMARMVLVVMLALFPLSVQATQDTRWVTLYDDEALERARPNREENGRKALEVLWPALTLEERAKLVGTQPDFPLRGANPLGFYSNSEHRRILLPILSLQFFRDLSVAYAWLHTKGFSELTPANYVTMLKYRRADEFPGKRYPLPLSSLGVPANAIDDPAVADLARKIYGSALAFIVAHELGHIYYRHPPGNIGIPQQARPDEVAADRFAVQLLRRMGSPPGGETFFFDLLAHLEQNRFDEGYEGYLASATHPLTSDRLRALSQEVERWAGDFARQEGDVQQATLLIREIGQKIRALAELMEDADIQASTQIVGRSTDLTALAPRRPSDFLAPIPPAGLSGGQSGTAWSGMFEGTMNPRSGNQLLARMELRRNGNRVTGRYTFGLGVGKIDGQIAKDDKLYYNWQHANSLGRGVLEIDPQTAEIRGSWGEGNRPEGGGTSRFHEVLR
jgi:hypothetical protein